MIEQIDWSLLTEHFIPQAVLGRPPTFFEGERGIVFLSGVDSFDYYKAALLSIDSAREIPIVLKQYRGARSETTTIYLNPSFNDVDRITELITNIVSDLGLSSADILWQRKDDPEA